MANGKLVISVRKPTPLWAKWVFRIFFAMTKIAAVWLYKTHLLTGEAKFEILLGFVAVDAGIWVIAKGLGVKKSDYKLDKKSGK